MERGGGCQTTTHNWPQFQIAFDINLQPSREGGIKLAVAVGGMKKKNRDGKQNRALIVCECVPLSKETTLMHWNRCCTRHWFERIHIGSNLFYNHSTILRCVRLHCCTPIAIFNICPLSPFKCIPHSGANQQSGSFSFSPPPAIIPQPLALTSLSIECIGLTFPW